MKDYKRALIDAGLRMIDSGLTIETWGNISIRNPENGNIYITPSGMPYDSLTEGDIVVLDGNSGAAGSEIGAAVGNEICGGAGNEICGGAGNEICGVRVIEGARKPSVEAGLHIAIYNNRKDVNAILHTHPLYSSVFGVLREDIPVVTDGMAQTIGGEVKCAEYALPGSDKLAENAACALGDVQACLLANHGAVCVGADLDECFKVSAVLESTAEIYLKALAIGDPVEIDSENVDAMRSFILDDYGQGK